MGDYAGFVSMDAMVFSASVIGVCAGEYDCGSLVWSGDYALCFVWRREFIIFEHLESMVVLCRVKKFTVDLDLIEIYGAF